MKPTHYAVISKDAATIDSLKFFDVDNCQDSEGKSPLHYAAANGDAKAVSAFLVMVAEQKLRNLKDKDGKEGQPIALSSAKILQLSMHLSSLMLTIARAQ